MEIIKISNTLKYIGDRKLLEINNLIIQRGEKVGIVGKNGVGKTTFLSLISGDIKQDEGKIEVYGQIAYIKQLDDININNSICVSGGEQMLSSIKEMINKNVEILLADEPSTNMDMQNIEYLIKELNNYQGTILIISHDRNVLDRVCNSIIEIDDGKVKKYKGNYTSYKMQKEAEMERNKFEYNQYIKEKGRLERAIKEANSTAKKMRKAPKRMGNSEARLHKREADNIREKIEGHKTALKSRLEKLEVKDKPKAKYEIYLRPPTSDIIKNKIAIKAENYTLKIGEKVLIKNANFYIKTNEITAIIGNNGVRKN